MSSIDRPTSVSLTPEEQERRRQEAKRAEFHRFAVEASEDLRAEEAAGAFDAPIEDAELEREGERMWALLDEEYRQYQQEQEAEQVREEAWGKQRERPAAAAIEPARHEAPTLLRSPSSVNFNDRSWTSEERASLQHFWQDRYATAPTMRAVGWGRDDERERFSPAGGDGLFVPRLRPETSREDMASAYRAHEEARWREHGNSGKEDQFRMRMLIGVEASAYQAWDHRQAAKEDPELKSEHLRAAHRAERDHARALGQLIDYDRKHQAPVANPERDLKKDPPTLLEREAWLSRGERRLTQLDRHTLHENGLVDEKNRPTRVPEAKNTPLWWVDAGTRAKIQDRAEGDRLARMEAKEEEKARWGGMAVLGVPGAAPRDNRLPRHEQACQVVDIQVARTKGPFQIRGVSADRVAREAVDEAIKHDQDFAHRLQDASAKGKGYEYVRDAIDGAKTRVGEAEKARLTGKTPEVLRSADVILLRGHNEVAFLRAHERQAERAAANDAVPHAAEGAAKAERLRVGMVVDGVAARLMARRERAVSAETQRVASVEVPQFSNRKATAPAREEPAAEQGRPAPVASAAPSPADVSVPQFARRRPASQEQSAEAPSVAQTPVASAADVAVPRFSGRRPPRPAPAPTRDRDDGHER